MRALISLSGGVDSTTLLAKLLSEGMEVTAIHFQYGSKHNPWEVKAVEDVTRHYGISFKEIPLQGVMFGIKSALMSGGEKIPEGHYKAENMKATVVPGRNLIFGAILAAYAESMGIEHVSLGVHAGDHDIYPDCRPEFIRYLCHTVQLSSEKKVRVNALFLYKDKTQIVREGLALKVPYHLTRTCYSESEIACGKCGACCERREAFQLNGVEDPIAYLYEGPLPEKP